MSERERLTHDPWGPSLVNALTDHLDKEVGPHWVGWHYGTTVPDAALLARFITNEAGRQVLAGVMLLGDAITADQLRKVPVVALENSANLTQGGLDANRQMHAELAKLPPLERGELSGEEFSRLVADHFKIWARHVPHPAAAMAAQWNVKPPTVHTWIREARLRGFLPAAKRGKG